MQRVFDFLRADDLPLMSRGNYSAELRQIMLWGVVVGAVDGAISSIVAAKTFHANQAATTLIWSLPYMINVLNPIWGVFLRGRRRLPAFRVIAIGGLAATASVAFTPADWTHSAWVFAGQVALIHFFLSGLITLRTTLWRVNYPQICRARIAGRLQTVRLLLMLCTGAGLSTLFDWQAWSYQITYPLVAAVGLVSLFPLRNMRVRQEKLELREVQRRLEERRATQRAGRLGLWGGLGEAVDILRSDRMFAAYMFAQFLLGAANFFTEPLLITIVTTRLDLRYFDSALITALIPTVVMLVGISYWAPVFDRAGVLKFRVYNSLMWLISFAGITTSMLIIGIAGRSALPIALVLLVVARIFTGLGRGSGAIAWNIGHLHFARPHQTELYMGIHVGLTGVRALVMPAVAYGCSQIIGYGSFIVAVVLAIIAHLLFHRLVRLSQADQPTASSG